MKNNKLMRASEIDSEEQLKILLERCEIPSNAPKDFDWLAHWWEKEFEPNLPPLARHLVIVGDDGFRPNLCLAIEHNEFVVYMLDEINWWFIRLGTEQSFSSAEALNEYLRDLVNQYHAHWKRLNLTH